MVINKSFAKFIWYALSELESVAKKPKDPRWAKARDFFALNISKAPAEAEDMDMDEIPEELLPAVRIALEKCLVDRMFWVEDFQNKAENAWRKLQSTN